MGKEIAVITFVGILIVLAITMTVSQKVGENKCNEIKTNYQSTQSSACDITPFSYEYYNQTVGSSIIRYNEETYQIIDEGQIALPIKTSDCALVTNEEEANKIIIHGLSYKNLQLFSDTSYKDTCTCNAQSVGAGEICSFTQKVNSIIENSAIETAAKNDKTTLNIVRAVAPAGYKIKSIEGTKILLSAVKELSHETFIGQSFEIVNTYTCPLQKLGYRIYDYSTFGNQLLLQMKSGNFYYGSEDALISINNDFKQLSNTNPNEMTLNRITADLFNANTCRASSLKPSYQSNLDAITSTLEYSKIYGINRTIAFIDYITPHKNNATEFKLKLDKLFTEYEWPNIVNAFFCLHTAPKYVTARITAYTANQKYNQGLYISSIKEFQQAEKEYSEWNIQIEDQIIGILIWSITGILVIFYIIDKHFTKKMPPELDVQKSNSLEQIK